ncbi:protein kinase domain-containing protein [Nakamurella sp.]|uniref:serine/threonine-protein kinase n=1 Tax=Nakamurella sp. TaxID=1869182 RepID=UPI003B3B19BE
MDTGSDTGGDTGSDTRGDPGSGATAGSPAHFGPYELRGLVGRGGMGEVYEAFDREQNRVVALKLLPEALIRDEGFVERFRRESFAAARLSDPHVIPIHRYGAIDGRLYLDMRLVRGRDLGQVIAQDGPLPLTRTVSFIAQAAEALDAAHADNLVHRDVKPTNLLITRQDFVYLVDFGIAHVFGMSTSGQALTATGATIGTLDYMAPERFTGRGEVDARTDVYSLACVLYECLTGQRPYPGDGLPGLMHAHLEAPPPRAGALRPDVPPALDRVIAIGMAKDPADRYPSTGELARAATLAVHGTVRPPGVGVTRPGVEEPPGGPTARVPDGAGGPATDPSLAPTRLGAVPPSGRSGGGPAAPVIGDGWSARPVSPARSAPSGLPAPPSGPPPPPRFAPPAAGPVPPAGPPARRGSATVWLVAAAGVVVVALVAGLLVWRLAGDAGSADGGGVAPTAVAGSGPGTIPSGPSPAPTPGPTPAPTPPATTVVTSTVEQTVTRTAAPPPRGSGDLGLTVAIANVPCNGSYLSLIHSATDPATYREEIGTMLAAHPGSSYLRTDASCGALVRQQDGNAIYAVYYGPFAAATGACGMSDAGGQYVKQMVAGLAPDEATVTC